MAGNTLWICRGRLDDAGASPTTPQGLLQQTSFSMREEDLGNCSAGSMRQREHLDEAMVACWVTFCAEAIRPLTLFAALHALASRTITALDRPLIGQSAPAWHSASSRAEAAAQRDRLCHAGFHIACRRRGSGPYPRYHPYLTTMAAALLSMPIISPEPSHHQPRGLGYSQERQAAVQPHPDQTRPDSICRPRAGLGCSCSVR
jgi:hypothetical protein